VVFHSAFGQVEMLGNFFIVETLAEEFDNFAFALAKVMAGFGQDSIAPNTCQKSWEEMTYAHWWGGDRSDRLAAHCSSRL
jgi:hypothetical protein